MKLPGAVGDGGEDFLLRQSEVDGLGEQRVDPLA
jgi:hypothetical protein